MLPFVLGVLFVATFIRSAFGFGEALIAVPLLALAMPVEVAAPVAVLVSITVAAVVLLRDWRQVRLRNAWVLFAATCFGIPPGLWLLATAPEAVVKAILALVIIAFSAFFLLRRVQPELRSDRSAPIFGFIAGVLGGAYGMNGPPLVAFASLRRWPPEQFRATLQGYFLPASILVMLGYASAGLWTPAVTRWYLLALPVVAIAIPLGRVANRRLQPRRFLAVVHWGLVATGFALLAQALA